MFDEKICPYPGLRPFNDEESIFFKGRERNVDTIVELFEKKKFMMLTGASGDGKSSLIYAGLVPQARGGLFKAKYNNWVVADFRPERDPLGNLTRALSPHLGVIEGTDLKRELSYGFSSLVKLYKQSDLYLDTASKAWLEGDEAYKKLRKRKASNLLIIADQFEEFFTNVENYHQGVASVESQTVVNLLLETAKLALAQDLPIYVICTMRSDYIGQCAAFRGLPEYIGFSQFFVPRLKRNEILQVIEEPAILNGDKISRRLSERLLNDITEGYDQLPILQHALNQIWNVAKKGAEELDLIHYAKVGGLAKEELPAADQKVFAEWYATLPEFKQRLFQKPSLENILNAHANELFVTAHKYYVDHKTGKSSTLTAERSQAIIETAFKCLTKIDESRAVRNRMTLQEITDIIHQPDISTQVVSGLLRLFRLQGNTFLRPFIMEVDNPSKMLPEQVLDITHESLIRNWDLLENWAKEENENWQNFQDFHKQLQRWISGGKSAGYLLPIGPLTFFENWYNTCKPNKFWLARYDESDLPTEEKLRKAEETLQQAEAFLKKSARRLMMARTVMKYGANRIMAAFGIVLFIFSCTYFYFDFRKKQNSEVLQEIELNGDELLKSEFIAPGNKAHYITSYEMLHPGSYAQKLELIHDDSVRHKVHRLLFTTALSCVTNKAKSEPALSFAEKLLWDIINKSDNSVKDRFNNKPDHVFKRDVHNIVSVVYGHHILNKNKFTLNDEKAFQNFCTGIYLDLCNLLTDTASLNKVNAENFNLLFQTIPDMVRYDSTKLRELGTLLNPFESPGKESFNSLYRKDKTVPVDWNKTQSHGGGYFQMCNLYALSGEYALAERCLDSLLKHNPEFFKIAYGYTSANLQIALLHSKHGLSEEALRFAQKIHTLSNSGNTFPIELMRLHYAIYNNGEMNTWRINMMGVKDEHSFNYQIVTDDFTTPQLLMKLEELIKYYKSLLTTGTQRAAPSNISLTEPSNVAYYLALAYKTKAFIYNQQYDYHPQEMKEAYGEALKFYESLSVEEADKNETIGSDNDLKTVKRSVLFMFPVNMDLTQTREAYNYYTNANRCKNYTAFAEYLLEHDKVEGYMMANQDVLTNWDKYFLNGIAMEPCDSTKMFFREDQKFELLLDNMSLVSKISADVLYGLKALDCKRRGDLKSAENWLEKVNLVNYGKSTWLGLKDTKVDHQLLSGYLMKLCFSFTEIKPSGKDKGSSDYYYQKAFGFMNCMPDLYRRRNILIECIDTLQHHKMDQYALQLSDSLLNRYASKSHKFGNKLFEMLGRYSTNETDKLCMQLMKDKTDKSRPFCFEYFVKGKIYSGNYYNTIQQIPEYVSSTSLLKLYSCFLRQEAENTLHSSALGWSNEILKDDYNLQPYEDAEGGYFFFSTSDE